MSNFESYEQIVTQLNEITHKLRSGKLSEEDMQRFVELSRELYERAVIMRYKAMEANVFGEVKAVEPEAAQKKEVVENTFMADAVIEEESPEEEEIQAKAERFEEGILFDFTTESLEPEVVEEPALTEEKKIEPEVESVEVEEVKLENPVTHTTTRTVHADGTAVTTFYRRFEEVHNDIVSNKLSNPRIESIRSSFGLNDRLQIISELFSGDSETFSKTVEELEGFDSSEKALRKLSEIAVQYRWDAENKLVEEFVRVVDRKFV